MPEEYILAIKRIPSKHRVSINDATGLQALLVIVKQMGKHLVCPKGLYDNSALAEFNKGILRINHVGRKWEFVRANIMVVDVDKPAFARVNAFYVSHNCLHVDEWGDVRDDLSIFWVLVV